MRYIRAILIVMIMWVNHCCAYFYQFYIVEKKMDADNSSQYIILLADYHDKNHYANKEQQAYFESLWKKYHGKNIKLIVEDLSSINNDGRMICGKYGINCTQSVLGYLACKARSCDISVDNVEYRYCRVASIGPLINNIKASPHIFKSSSSISVGSLHKEVSDEIEKIKKYNDGEKLNIFYKNVLTKVHDKLSAHSFCDKNRDKTVAYYCAQLKRKKYRQELEKLCIFDSELLDSNILHSIASSKASVIFVVAGGSHIQQVYDVLKEIGYQDVFVTSSETTFIPINLSTLDKYIDRLPFLSLRR